MKVLTTVPAMLVCLCLFYGARAQQGAVGIGTESPNQNSVLHLVSPGNNQGLLVPRLTTSQRTASSFVSNLSQDDNGLLVFDSDEKAFYYWLDDQWINAAGKDQLLSFDPTTFELTLSDGNTISLSELSEVFSGEWTDITGIPPGLSDGTDDVDDADADPSNEIQDLGFDAGILSMSGDPDSTQVDLSGYDSDVSDDFSGSWNDLADVPAGFSDGTDDVDDADADPTNEIQDLQLVGQSLSITGLAGATEIDLAPYAGTNTDEQDLSFADNIISLTGDPDGTQVDLSGYDRDTLDDFSGSWNALTDIPAGFSDGTDDVNDADADPANEIELPATALSGQVLKYNGTAWQAGTDNAGASPPWNENGSVASYGGSYALANNFISTPVLVAGSEIVENILSTEQIKYAKVVMITSADVTEIYQITSGVSGQQLILVAVGGGTLSLNGTAAESNLYLPNGSDGSPVVNLGTGSSIHLIYIKDEKGLFDGWVCISSSVNAVPASGK